MYDFKTDKSFRTDPNLTEEQRTAIACDNWLECAYEFQKEVDRQDEYWEKDMEEQKVMEQEDREANKALDEWIEELKAAKLAKSNSK